MFLQVLVGDAVAIGMRHHQIANKCLQKKTEYLPPGLPCLAEGEIPDMGVFLPATANAVATEALIAWHFLL